MRRRRCRRGLPLFPLGTPLGPRGISTRRPRRRRALGISTSRPAAASRHSADYPRFPEDRSLQFRPPPLLPLRVAVLAILLQLLLALFLVAVRRALLLGLLDLVFFQFLVAFFPLPVAVDAAPPAASGGREAVGGVVRRRRRARPSRSAAVASLDLALWDVAAVRGRRFSGPGSLGRSRSPTPQTPDARPRRRLTLSTWHSRGVAATRLRTIQVYASPRAASPPVRRKTLSMRRRARTASRSAARAP